MGYEHLAYSYDLLTKNVDYKHIENYLKDIFKQYNIQFKNSILLDLACGTGTFSIAFAKAGYEVIGVDNSIEMLMQAREKASERNVDVLFLNQDMLNLDLYGTVDGAICMLDAFNHLDGLAQVEEALKKVSLFLRPKAVFIFDMNTPYKHQTVLGNSAFVLEEDETVCVWQNFYQPKNHLVEMQLDFFEHQQDDRYERYTSEIAECAYETSDIIKACQNVGLKVIATHHEYTNKAPNNQSERITYITMKEE